MPEQGRLTDWNDDRGFGYIKPLDGGPTVFVHISEFPRDQRRPQVTDLLRYEVSLDDRGRTRATSVSFLSAARGASQTHFSSGSSASGSVAVGISALFLVFVTGLAAIGRIPGLIPLVYVVMSVIAFGAYGIDKRAAQANDRRTGEGTLIGLGLFGGWPGALIARQVYRHKTRKQPFVAIFWGSIAMNVAALFWYAAISPLLELS